MNNGFPDRFLWGCATSAYQIEGSPLADGAGPSIWQRFAHTPGRISGGDTGDIACDHYRRWREDVALMRDLGLTAYRFSIAWSPRAARGPRPRRTRAGLDFYERLVDELLRAGITPDGHAVPLGPAGGARRPRRLAQPGHRRAGSPTTRAWSFEALDDRVPLWATINEPWVVADGGYMHGVLAPGHRSAFEAAIAAHQLLRAHAAAVQAYRAIGRAPDRAGRQHRAQAPRRPGQRCRPPRAAIWPMPT